MVTGTFFCTTLVRISRDYILLVFALLKLCWNAVCLILMFVGLKKQTKENKDV